MTVPGTDDGSNLEPLSLSQFVEFSVITQAVKENLDQPGLFDALCRDKELCKRLAEKFDTTVGDERQALHEGMKGDLPERPRDQINRRLLEALDRFPSTLKQVLAAEGAGRDWLTQPEQRERVIKFIASQRSDTPETGDSDREIIEAAIRASLGLTTDAAVTTEQLNRVTELALGFTEVTDAGLASLAPLTQLQTLDLTRTRVTDAGLASLAPLTQLQGLYLGDTRVTDAGLAFLAPLMQLQGLYLGYTRVTDAGLAFLAPLTQLQELYLSRTQLTDAALASLTPLTHLQGLDLGGTRVTDAGLASLAPLTQLQSLYLGGTRVTDAGLAYLAPLTQLQTLYLTDTQVTDAAVTRFREKRLKESLPNCAVHR